MASSTAHHRSGRRALAAAGSVALVIALAGPAYAAGPGRPGAAGLGDRLFPTLGNGGYDVTDYDLHLTYPRKDPWQQISGDVTISAVATQDLTRFDLDFGGDSVAGVAVNGRPATFTREGDELVITPARTLGAARPFTVRVTGFRTTPPAANLESPAGPAVHRPGHRLPHHAARGQPGIAGRPHRDARRHRARRSARRRPPGVSQQRPSARQGHVHDHADRAGRLDRHRLGRARGHPDRR